MLMNLFVLLSYVSFTVCLLLSVYSLYLNPRAGLNRVFSFFTLCLCIWSLAYANMLLAPSVENALFWRQVSSVGYCFFYVGLLHFVLILTGYEQLLRKWWLYVLLYVPAVLVFVNHSIIEGMQAERFIQVYNVWYYMPPLSDLRIWGVDVYIAAYVLITLVLMVRWRMKTKSPRERKQADIVVLTLFIAVLAGFVTDVILPARNIVFPPIATVIVLIPASGIWWAITKYKMLVLTPAYAADHILATLGDPVLVFDAKTRVKFVNDAALEFLEYGENELLCLRADDIFAGESFDVAEVHDVGATVVTGRGQTVPILLSSTLIYDDVGEFAGVVCVMHDITQMKESEDALRKAHEELEKRVLERTQELKQANLALARDLKERTQMEILIRGKEEKLRLLTDNMLDMIIRIDLDGRMIYVSPSHSLSLGYEPSVLEGRLIYEFIHPDDAAGVMKTFHEAGSSATGRMELRARHADGHYCWLESIGKFIRGEQNTFNGLIVCSRDITKRKEMEEQLKILSMFDSLTGLYNRNYFEQEMQRLGNGRYNPVGLVICDVDGLKLYNDSLGHVAGDKLLKDIAGIIKSCFRSCDVVARVGGDEFAVLLPNTVDDEVQDVCKRVRAAVNDYYEKHHILPVSVSIGYSVRETMAESMSSIFRHADDNMYREKLHRSQSVRSAVSQILKKALEARDYVTEGHAMRLEGYVAGLAGCIGLSEQRTCDLRLFAQFHDVGKVGITDTILLKPVALSAEERREMQRHCEIGHRIALSAPDLAPIADWILKHHEWWDGEGYPFGLKGDDIPLECRILAIADAYDAMTSDRPYRNAMTREDALAELVKFRGIQFDPGLVDMFAGLVEDGYFDEERQITTVK